MKKDKVILTDCDGVVLDWEEGFTWMEHPDIVKPMVNAHMYTIGDRYGMFMKIVVKWLSNLTKVRQ